MLSLRRIFSEIDVALVHLPGMHSPFFARHRPEAFAVAFDEVLMRLGHSQVLVLGASIGGLAALCMRSPTIRRAILIDTPLTTSGLSPIQDDLRRAVQAHELAREWLEAITGIFTDQVVEVDYRHLLNDVRVPVTAVFGAEAPGVARSGTGPPSLVPEADRECYRSQPNVREIVVPGVGHNISGGATQRFIEILQAEVAALQVASA
jgi:pimeloyl-ACP methyl ester carboxylesterase